MVRAMDDSVETQDQHDQDAVDRAGEIVSLNWRETGARGVHAPDHTGFGTRMIDLSARGDLGGSIERDWCPDGLDLHLSFTLPAADA